MSVSLKLQILRLGPDFLLHILPKILNQFGCKNAYEFELQLSAKKTCNSYEMIKNLYTYNFDVVVDKLKMRRLF